MSDEISIQFTRFSAFYSPLIATIAGGFLEHEGLTPRHSVAPAGKSAIEGVVAVGLFAARGANARKVHDSYLAFRDKVSPWSKISLRAVLEARG